MKDKKRDIIRLHHIYDAIEDIPLFLSESDEDVFQTNKMLQSACVRQLEIIGEAASR